MDVELSVLMTHMAGRRQTISPVKKLFTAKVPQISFVVTRTFEDQAGIQL